MKYDNIDIEWLGHSCFKIKGDGKVIYIDPYNLSGEYEKADVILITHSHYDHCSAKDLSKVVKKETTIIMSADCFSVITRLQEEVKTRILTPGKAVSSDKIKVVAVPSHNNNKRFHPIEEEWNGYILEIAGIKIYHAGDTDFLSNMQNLNSKIDIALLPVGGEVTMNADEAASAAFVIQPKLAIPMHYGTVVGKDSDALRFVQLCQGKGIDARILEKK